MLSTHDRQETADAWWRIPRRWSRCAVSSVDVPSSVVERGLAQKIHARISTRWFGLIIVLIAFFVGAWLTWRKWPDVLVDFGIQLYLPWSISTGSVLYRDVMHLAGGPLSQYYHALLFSIFGASYLTIVISNLTIALALVVLIYRSFLACSDVWTATTISMGVILVFTFNQFSDIGNYNFISPYSHEVWHGTVLSIVAVTLLSRWLVEPKRKFAAGAGFCAGLVFMTKPDVFAALMMSFIAALALAVTKDGVKAALRLVLWALVAALPPVLAFLLYFHHFEDWRTSARSVAFAWVPVLGSSVSKEPFYKWCMGLDVPSYHIRAMLIQFLIIGAAIMTCAIWFRREINTPTKRVVTVGLIALLLALASGIDWVDCGRSLPLLVLVLGVLLAIKYRSAHGDERLADTPDRSCLTGINRNVPATVIDISLVFPILWCVFAFGLLAKLGFYTRIWHYGFILAMPAFVAAVYLLLWFLPQLLQKYSVRRNFFRATIWLLLLTGFLRLFVQSQVTYRNKNVPVGHGKDVLLAFDEKVNPAGPAIQSALDWMEKNVPRQSTLAVLPEGAIVNYLGRWRNPTRYLAWDPAQIAGFGQDNMISAFENNCPDYVMLIHRDSFDYGVKFFGQEEKFGLKLMQWIEANYQPVYLVGNEPLRNSLFGIKILKRISSKESK
jgi:hypothetical protein